MDFLQEMKQVSVTEILKEHNLVVPEIQREYVWGRNDYDILDSFLEDVKKGFSNISNTSDEITKSLMSLLERASEEEKEVMQGLIKVKLQESNVMNIGFLYSYKPNYYINDEGKDAYLIDGQQRFTTIFLILFYLAIKENRLRDFINLYRVKIVDSKIAFDYRVRSLTHNFIIDLVKNTSKIEDLLTISGKRWFLSNYRKDTTIRAIIGDESSHGAFKIIHHQLKNEPNGYFDHVRQNIKFWHFKTEETSQGEELYITMNSRGQQLADNETIRAALFQSDIAKSDPIKWSALWEEWQDFFWKNRAKVAISADKGFNEFLACIGGLQNYLSVKSKNYSKEDFENFNQISSKDILNNLSLPIIEVYINALKFISHKEKVFKDNYNYVGWLDKCISEIWGLFNLEYTNWYADHEDANRATERNRMIFAWSFLYYFQIKDENKVSLDEISVDEVFRLVRMFYLRYNNHNRSVASIKQTIDLIEINGVFDTLKQELKDLLDENGQVIPVNSIEETDLNIKSGEENLKCMFLNKFIGKPDEQRKYEELLWKIEDHKLNLNGRDVGGINISYLVDLNKEHTLFKLEIIKNKLYEIFPEKQKEYPIVQSILLYYGEYWHRVSPWYYFNNQFDNWRRIIRDRDHSNKHTRDVFKRFFTEFVAFDGNIEEFLEEKRKTVLKKSDCTELHQKLCWYNHYLDDKMWSQGNYLAFSNGTDPNALPDYTNSDKVFSDMCIIYNTKGNLKGGRPKELYNLLPKDIKHSIKL